MARKLRVLIAKPGFDGHDLGAKVVARALRDAGCEVVYTGLKQTPEQIVAAAIQEDVDIIGASIYSGAHLGLMRKICDLLREKGVADRFVVVVGGTIPSEDIPQLKATGVKGVFPMRTPLKQVVDFVLQQTPQ